MDDSFKSLPPQLFKKVDSPNNKTGILWLPTLEKSAVTSKLDWLSGMQISRLQFSPSKKWPLEIKEKVKNFNLPLDEKPPFEHHNTLIFSLPKGFKSSLGLIVQNSTWKDREEVYNRYMAACDAFKRSEFFIQSLDIWASPQIPKIEWIKV